MKKILTLLAAVAMLAPAVVSCDAMLEEKNYGNPTTKEMMAKEENVALLVGQAYADVKWLHDHWGYWGVVTLTADEGVCPIRMPDKDWADGNYWRNLNTHNWDVMGQAFRNIWNSTISGAVLCNKLISTLETYKESMSETVFAQYIGELEVMRSYYYYMLFDCFGRIPYLEKFEETTEPLMAPEKVWSRLVDCLERNAPNMAVVNDANRALNYGRATQGFAYALLARLYLNAESFGCTPSNIDLKNTVTTKISSAADFYTNAVRCCDAIIASGSYSIEENFFTNFKIQNEGSRENIFVIVENGNAKFDKRDSGSMSNKLRLTILTLNYNHQQTYNMIEKPWNGFCARPSFIDRFAASDVRGPGNEGKGTNDTKQWGWFLGPIYDAAGKLCKDKDAAKSDAIIVKDVLDANGNPSLVEATDLGGARNIKYEIDDDALLSRKSYDLRYRTFRTVSDEYALHIAVARKHFHDRISSGNHFESVHADHSLWFLIGFIHVKAEHPAAVPAGYSSPRRALCYTAGRLSASGCSPAPRLIAVAVVAAVLAASLRRALSVFIVESLVVSLAHGSSPYSFAARYA